MRFVWLCIFLFTITIDSARAAGFPAELAMIGSFPNPELPFVQKTVVERFDLLPLPGPYSDYMTGITYFAARNGVTKLSILRTMEENGSTDYNDYFKAIKLAGQRAPIVLSPLGGGFEDEKVCELAAQFPNTAFLLVNANDGAKDAPNSSCFAANLLFVAGLNEMRTDLAVDQEKGGKQRLAVPYMKLRFPVEEGKSVTYSVRALGLAMAAGKMAELLRAEPGLRGAALIQRFLDTKATYLPALEGKVVGAKALLLVNE